MTILDLAELELLQDLGTDKLEIANAKAWLKEASQRRYYLDLIDMVIFKYKLEEDDKTPCNKEPVKVVSEKD